MSTLKWTEIAHLLGMVVDLHNSYIQEVDTEESQLDPCLHYIAILYLKQYKQ